MYHIKEDKRSKQSSEFIYNALEELMAQSDFNSITVTDLVDRAKVGRTTFYRNFETTYDVLKMKCDEKFQELYEFLIQYYRGNNQPITPPFLKPFLRFWYVNPNIIKLLIKADRLDIIKDSFISLVEKFKGILPEEQFYNGDNSKYQNYFKEIRYSISISILIEWIKNDTNIAPDDLAKVLMEQLKVYSDLNLLL